MNEIRVRSNFVSGLIDDNPLTISATTLTATELASLPAIGSTQHAAIILDPDGTAGAPEVVYVTAHTASATTATILRAQEGTTAREHLLSVTWAHGATVQDYDGVGGGAGLIGIKSYNPAVAAIINTTSTTHADVDATNLAVTFTAPPSGRVLVGLCSRFAVTSNTSLDWALRDGAAVVTGTVAVIAYSASSDAQDRSAHRTFITGLTPGTSYTMKWSHARSFGSGTAGTVYGGANGEALMEVWAVNL